MDVPCDLLYHPELLTNEQLRGIIIQRHLKIDVESMPREQLLNVFHQYCVPYGQRRYRDSGRGRMLNKTRQMSPETTLTLNTINNTQYKRTLCNNERMKPPPDLLTGHLKRIKLDNNSGAANLLDHGKRKIGVDLISNAAESPPNKKERKQITWP